MHICTYLYTFTFIHKYIHTFIHTYTLIFLYYIYLAIDPDSFLMEAVADPRKGGIPAVPLD